MIIPLPVTFPLVTPFTYSPLCITICLPHLHAPPSPVSYLLYHLHLSLSPVMSPFFFCFQGKLFSSLPTCFLLIFHSFYFHHRVHFSPQLQFSPLNDLISPLCWLIVVASGPSEHKGGIQRRLGRFSLLCCHFVLSPPFVLVRERDFNAAYAELVKS